MTTDPNALIGTTNASAPERGWCFMLDTDTAMSEIEATSRFRQFEPGTRTTTLTICKDRVVVFAATLARHAFTQAIDGLGPALERLNALDDGPTPDP